MAEHVRGDIDALRLCQILTASITAFLAVAEHVRGDIDALRLCQILTASITAFLAVAEHVRGVTDTLPGGCPSGALIVLVIARSCAARTTTVTWKEDWLILDC